MKTHLLLFVAMVLAGATQGTEAAHIAVAETVTSAVNVRAGATVDSAIIGKLRRGDALVLIEELPQWFVVRLYDGQTGYVHRGWTREIHLGPPPAYGTETEAAEPYSEPVPAEPYSEVIEEQSDSKPAPAQSFSEPGVTTNAQVETTESGDPDFGSVEGYRLNTNDRVRVVIFGHEDLSGEFAVDESGRLSLPLIQFVQARNLTTQELERAITDRLRPDYLINPRVSVEILSLQPVYVIGEVREPGSYPFTSGMTVLNAVALAGGYTYRAARKKMTITEAADPERRKARVSEDSAVQPGDVIEIPERLF